MKLKVSLLIVLFALLHLHSQEIQTSKFGKGILNLVGKDSSWTMKFAARMQLLGTSTWDEI